MVQQTNMLFETPKIRQNHIRRISLNSRRTSTDDRSKKNTDNKEVHMQHLPTEDFCQSTYDSVEFWNGATTPEEVAELYDEEFHMAQKMEAMVNIISAIGDILGKVISFVIWTVGP
ncbi:hypothetical protein QR680_018102 [Steinernema hermaphroditum]|nr:hypothetical protein QR680_018102 [Steinernema hermaphroditum]